METLDEFNDITDKELEKKENLEEKVETLDSHIQKIVEAKDNYIPEKLNALQGDAADKVKATLEEQSRKKIDLMNESKKEIEDTEEMLSAKLRILDDQISERNDALVKVEQLGIDAEIDVSESRADIAAEIEEMKAIRENIIDKLTIKAKTTGRTIII